MGYRPDEQALGPPIDKILEGIKELEKAIEERLESNEWSEGHQLELKNLETELHFVKRNLAKLRRETW